MNHSGFSLLELVIALLISSMMALALYQTFHQTQKTVMHVDAFIQRNVFVTLLYNQLDKDISSIFVPHSAYSQESSKKSDKKNEEKASLEKIIYAQSEQGHLKELSFITTSALIGYNEIAQRLIRVTYVLKSEANDLFTLMRTESTQLEYGPEKPLNVNSYVIAEHIKNFSITFYVSSSQQEKSEYNKISEWSSGEQFKKMKRRVPDYIEISVVWYDTELKKDHSFNYIFPIIAQERKEKQEQTDEEKTQQQASDKTQKASDKQQPKGQDRQP